MNKILYASTSLIAFLMLFCSCADTPKSQGNGVRNIGQEEFAKIVKDENATVIDVRTPAEVAQGYIAGTNIFADINGTDFENQMAKLDPDQVYIVYCRSGSRSSSAANYMVGKGFKKVYNLEGGITSWKGDVIKP